MARSLAHIEVIKELYPIEGKDRIELAIILGWSVIVKKGEFNVGDKCIYVEIDSVMPPKPEYEFLRGKNFRIKTMKMAGVLSQGICFPMSLIGANYPVGTDVTEKLGITQYEATRDIERESNGGKRPPIKHYPKWLMRFEWFRQYIYKKDHRGAKGFPDFISKTDETRIESIPHVLAQKDRIWTCTEKMDGQSGTFALKKHKNWYGKTTYEFIVCSRNLRLWADDGSNYWQIAKKYKIEEFLRSIIGDEDWVAIQGEICGPGIQGNKYKFPELRFFGFNLRSEQVARLSTIQGAIIANERGIDWVPIICNAMTLPDTIDDMHDFVTRPSVFGETLAEGCVFRDPDGVQSFKSVSPTYLMKYDE